jgi:diguanylate cyclase (GGDEF)-like protein
MKEVLVAALSTCPLTRLRNSYGFQRDATEIPEGAMLAVIAVELNGFKNLNTRYGHSGGDLVLNEVGVRLESLIEDRGDDTLTAYHLSGDEYQILARNLQVESARELARSLKERLEKHPYSLPGERETENGEVTVTVAVAHRGSLGGPDDLTQLLREADELVEFRKFEDARCDGSLLPEILTVEDAGDVFRTYKERLSQSRRHRVRCEKCGRFGYLNTPLGFSQCPDCSLLKA